MTPGKTPKTTGYYWATWHTNTDDNPHLRSELDFLAAHKDRYIVLVRWDSNEPEKLPEAERLIVHMPGIRSGQYVHGFDWGDRVADEPPDSEISVAWDDYFSDTSKKGADE